MARCFPTVLGSPEGSDEVQGQRLGIQVDMASWAPEGKPAPDATCGLQSLSGWWWWEGGGGQDEEFSWLKNTRSLNLDDVMF